MEFRYRAGDARDSRSSSIHPHPIRGSFIMPDIERGTHMFPRPMQMTAAMHREILKERIREEMIASDMAERRILEEEVRREIDMEERMGIRRVLLAESLRFAPPARRQRLPETVILERALPRPVSEFAYRGRDVAGNVELSKPRHCEIEPGDVYHLPWSVRQELLLKQREDPQIGVRNPVVPECMSKSGVLGLKRKANTDGLEATQKTSGCSLCQVITTSEEQLKEHLTGKKHKAMLAKMSTNNMGSTTKSSTSEAYAQESVISLPQTGVTKKVRIMVNGKLSEVIQKEDYLWCMQCKTKCNSTMLMYGHLSGKKHARRLGLSENGHKLLKTTAAISTEDATSQVAEADVKIKDLGDVSKEAAAEEESSSD